MGFGIGDWRLEIRNVNWDWKLKIAFGNESWECVSEMDIGNGDLKWRLEMEVGHEYLKWRLERVTGNQNWKCRLENGGVCGLATSSLLLWSAEWKDGLTGIARGARRTPL